MPRASSGVAVKSAQALVLRVSESAVSNRRLVIVNPWASFHRCDGVEYRTGWGGDRHRTRVETKDRFLGRQTVFQRSLADLGIEVLGTDAATDEHGHQAVAGQANCTVHTRLLFTERQLCRGCHCCVISFLSSLYDMFVEVSS